jgi:glycosyltransferase involved in cell wall biosynthesis
MKKNKLDNIRVGILATYLDKKFLTAPELCQKKLISAILDINDPFIDFFLIHFQSNNYNTTPVNAQNVLTKRNPFSLTKCIRSLNLNIMHVNYIPYKWPQFFFLPEKKVVTIHGDAAFVLPKKYFSFRVFLEKNILKTLSLTKILKKIDLYIPVSYSVKKNISRYLNIPKDKMQVVYNATDKYMHPILMAKKKVKKIWNIHDPFILNVNNYAPKKNIESLVKAFLLLKKDESFLYKLVLVGKNIKTIKKKYKNFQDILYLEYINNKKLPILYSAAELFVNPSLHETFGIPNLEAISCGCPVVTSKKYAIPEIMNNSALYLNNPQDIQEISSAIKTMINNKKMKIILREKGIKQSQKFSWKKSASRMISLYKSLVVKNFN